MAGRLLLVAEGVKFQSSRILFVSEKALILKTNILADHNNHKVEFQILDLQRFLE